MNPTRTIRVLFKKIPKNNNVSIDEIIKMSNDLTKNAQIAPGFISSKSFWNNDLNDTLYLNKTLFTFSDWENINYWNSWLESDQRKNTLNYYDIKFDSEITILKNKINPFSSIPLL